MATRSLAVTRATAPPTLGAQRKLQIALGVVWLLDGGLQLQPFMFTQIIAPNAIGQPPLVGAPITFMAHLIEPRVAAFNVLAVTIQFSIGAGLIYRPTVKAALSTSFAWALSVWWIGEGLGGLFTGSASPLTGAPGAALLYVLAGLIAWPRDRRQTRPTGMGGLLGERGARTAWALLWLGSAALWLLPANRADTAVHDAIANAPSGARWLSSFHSTVAAATAGHGAGIAIGAAVLSAAIGVAVLFARCPRLTLALSAVIAVGYTIIGQGMGGVLTGSGTDLSTGPLLILLAIAIYPLHRSGAAAEPVGGTAGLPGPDSVRVASTSVTSYLRHLGNVSERGIAATGRQKTNFPTR
jgi:hypothetical protein